ncbi:MAG: metallophosphoesterase [Oscillospiraceae bacterium]|nr:metallophosphoesterase [Oscillospiraceae bacterium]
MICVIGDTHGDYSRFSHKKIKALKSGDYLIICGDFGFVWDGSAREEALLKKIGSKRYTTIFLTGSHDNYELLEKYPPMEFMGGTARHICGRLYMLISGEVLEIDGHKLFVFGGGSASDIDARLENDTWWEQEVPDESLLENGLKNLSAIENKVDYIFTHEPPGSIAEFLERESSNLPMSRLNIFFDKLKGEVAFKMWFFGKLHRNKLVPPRYMSVFDEPYIIE